MSRSQSYCFLTIYIFFCLFPLPNTFASPTPSLCRRNHRNVLFELQKEFHVPTTWWNKSVDCCSWEGVTCDTILGEVISLQLNFYATGNTSLKPTSGLFKLQHIRKLDLSNCRLQGEIPSSIGNLSHLIVLDLSDNQLVGQVPASIGNLNQLRYMDLSGNKLKGNIPTSFANLSKLSHFRLSGNQFSVNTSLKSVGALFKLRHLRELDLSGCNLQGEIPFSIGNLSYLTSLDLSGCNLHGEIPSSIRNLSRLTSLDLSGNQLVGEVPASIGNLNQLRYMYLWENKLTGNIPTSFANLTKLSHFYISGNQLTGGEIVLANLTSLFVIDLSSNHFKSSIFPYLSGLLKLELLRVNGNSFFVFFPSFLLMIPSLLEIDLSQNQFEGPIDYGNTSSSSKLRWLNVGDNNFDGLIPESISKLVNLTYLNLSHNNFGGGIPISLYKLVNLETLDLSYNRFEGKVPQFLWRSSKLNYVQLSHNFLNSYVKSVEIDDGSPLLELNLGSNSFQGPFPQWICKFRDLSNLDLSNNHFTGSIPQCLKNFTNLQTLDLRNNSLSGFLPDLCIDGTHLRSVDVSRNNLVGKLPKSLSNCTEMEFLNVRGNKIKDMFPFWLGSLQSLSVLLLRSNAFYGPVYNPSAYLGFPGMRIIDISNNNFVGSLPQDYFANWTEMSLVWSGYDSPELNYMGAFSDVRVFDSMDLVYKGVDTDFARIFLGFKAIDFSGNRFSGYIPESIGLFSELRLLNLSGNTFTGNIPPSLENITKLETLDLSRNNLSGEIPQGLGKLTFLSNINFSHNHLEGLVPQNTQFESQNCSSFVGNLRLYGLERICRGSHHVPIPTSQQPNESLSEAEEPVMNWIAAEIAFGLGVFYGLVIGHIFTSYKHE